MALVDSLVEWETIFHVPRLLASSVASGGCCPVPAEAIILPEIELMPGVLEASADWQTAEVRVRHAPTVDPADLAQALSDVSYPAERWTTTPHPA